MSNKNMKVISVTSFLYLVIVTNYESRELDKIRQDFIMGFKNIKASFNSTFMSDCSYSVIEIRNTKKETINDDVFEYIYKYFN